MENDISDSILALMLRRLFEAFPFHFNIVIFPILFQDNNDNSKNQYEANQKEDDIEGNLDMVQHFFLYKSI